MVALGGGWSEESTRSLKKGIPEKGLHPTSKNRLTSIDVKETVGVADRVRNLQSANAQLGAILLSPLVLTL